jgi:integrase
MKLRINFTLKTGLTKEIPVLAILNYGYKEYDVTKQKTVYKPMKYYTGIKVTKSEWDETLKLPLIKPLRNQLLQIEQQINDVFHVLKLNGEITPNNLKNALDQKIKGKKSETVKRVRIVDFVQNEIIVDPNLKHQTKTAYGTFCTQMIQLEQKLGKPIYSNEFNEDVYKLFIDYVRSQSTRVNSVVSAYKLLSATLRKIAFKYKINVFNLTLELPASQKVRGSVNQKVYLNFEQIQKIIDYEPETRSMKNIKLIFLTLLFTGVRFSDVFKVKPEFHYSQDDISFSYTWFVTQKNGKQVIIPILKPLADAFKANGGNTAYKINGIMFNNGCKELVRLSGIDEQRTLSYTDAYGKIQFETKPFYELVSSHTGRRSFVSNLIHKIPLTILSKITTHAKASVNGNTNDLSDNNVIFTYDQSTELENAVFFVRELKFKQEMDKRHFVVQLV